MKGPSSLSRSILFPSPNVEKAVAEVAELSLLRVLYIAASSVEGFSHESSLSRVSRSTCKESGGLQVKSRKSVHPTSGRPGSCGSSS